MPTNEFFIDFNVTGAERKRLVQAIATYMQTDAKYLGAPTFAYQVDGLIIDRSGVVSFDSEADRHLIDGLIEILPEQGFVAQISGLDRVGEELPAEEKNGEPAPDSAAQGSESLIIQMPTASFTPEALNNLHSLVAAKGRLIPARLWVLTSCRSRWRPTRFPSPGSAERPPARRSRHTRT